MDIEELRRRAMASMPHKKKQQQCPQVQPQKVSSDPQSGKSPANKWLEASAIQTPLISCAPSAPSFSGSRKERDVFLSTLQDLHPSSISPAAEGKDDNLVIRFSDGESDSDVEEIHLKMDESHGDVSFRGNIIGPSGNHSPAASSHLTLTSASQHAPGMWNQMAMMKQQLAAVRTSMSSAIQVRGDGSTWKSSSKQKHVIGQKGSIGQKRGIKPGASVTKPSGSNLDNLKKKIATKSGTDVENLRKQIATKGGTDLENLRKQIATKENELMLQRHMKSGKGQGMVSVPNGKLHIPGIGKSTAGNSGRQLSPSPASLKLAGTSDEEMGEEKRKVLQVTLQELPDAGLNININSLQQQRRNTSNTDTEYNRAKDGSIAKYPIRDLHSAGSKSPHTEDNPVGQKYEKTAVDIDERNVASSRPVFDSVLKHCTGVESNIYSSNFSMNMPTSTPSKRVLSEDFHHTTTNGFSEREGNKRCKVDGPSMGSRNDVNLARDQASAQYTPEHQKHSSVEGFQNKESEEVHMEIEETERLAMNESVKTTEIENCSQKKNSGVEQSIVNYWKNAKKDIDGHGVHPLIEEGCFDLTYGRQLAGPACENMSTLETSADVSRGARKTGVPTIFTSKEVVQWQGNRGSLINARPVGIHIQDDLLQCGNISLQNLKKEEELVDKELEEAREHRSRCEMEEMIAWKAYQKAQTAVQAANRRCMDLHKKRESLSVQVRDVAMRDRSSQGSLEQVEERKEGFFELPSFLRLKNLSNMDDITPSMQDRLEASEHPDCKLNKHGSIVDYAIISSSEPCIGNNLSSTKYGFQSVLQNSNVILPMADVVPNAAKESCMADKNIGQTKIYGSISSGVAVDQDQNIVSCEPEILLETGVQINEMKGKHGVNRESTLKVTKAFQRQRSKLSENMEICKGSDSGLRREDNLVDSIIDTTGEIDENCELMSKSYINPEILLDEKKLAVGKTGESYFEQATTERNCLPQKRKWSNLIPTSEYGADGRAKFSHASVSKLNPSVDSLSLTEKTKEEGTASPCAETSAESLHGQNYDQEYNIQFPVRKHEKFACAYPESLERILEVPEEVVKTTTVGHLIDDDAHGHSAGTCHSESSLASGIVYEKTINKRFATSFSSLKCEKVTFEESNEERCLSGSSVDEGEKENTVVWKNSIEEQATSGNSGGYPDGEQLKVSDLTMLEDFNGRSAVSDVAYMENQDSIQQLVCAYPSKKTLGEIFAQRNIQAVNRKDYEDGSSQPPESDFWTASSELKVIFSCAKEILSISGGILGRSYRKMTQTMFQDLPENVPKFLLYESPLDMFKSYRIYNNLIAADGIPDKSITCSHVINPFWPLCKFEHRGKCNNEDCPWQHARDYSLNPTQFVEQLKQHSNSKVYGLAGDCKQLNNHGNDDPQINFRMAKKEAITRGFKIHFAVTTEQSVVSQGFSCHTISSYGLIVPVYRIGSHLIKADVPMVGALIARSTWRYWKLGFCQSFPIPFAIQRLILPDMPYLRSAAVREWMLGNNSRLPTCLYSSSANPDDTKKHLFRGLGNVECWLELAIDAMNYDSNIDKSDGRKKALCVLSRAIEANPNSVALWVVYLHLFYRKEKVVGKDDMFHHAVQHNEGSYELWLLFINSRLQIDQRLEAYKNAIASLCLRACANETQDKSISPYALDLVLQMLNFLSLSVYKQKAMTWIDELLSCSTEASNNERSDFISISTILACLTRKDACVLWVSCTYFRVYGILPKSILEWLEFEQNLPFDVEWYSCHLSEDLINCTIKLMNTAVSCLSECEDNCASQSWHNDSNSLLPVHALVINHVKCVSAFEGLMSARKLCCRYRELYPSCVELVLISSSIESQSGDVRAGIALFDESLTNWPESKPGIQCLWNQYVGYVVKSEGIDSAKDIINKWFCYMDQHKTLDNVISFRCTDYPTSSTLGHAVGKQGEEEYKEKRKQVCDFSKKIGLDMRSSCQEMMFALLNLAIYSLLNNDTKKAQSAVDQALKVALGDGNVKHCIRECAALALFSVPDGLEPMKNDFDTRMIQLLDKCFLRSQLFPIPKPLSRAFTESIKKPKIQFFIENLLGSIPVDCSLLNSILEIWYGPSLLPEKFDAFKDLVNFLEGLLELAPANFKLVLSLCRMIVQRFNSQNISSTAAFFWASSLLIYSIFQSFPVAPENAWLEVGNFLELLDVDVILEEFYQQALSVHPFSVALWHSFLNFRRRSENLAGVVETAKHRGIIMD